METMENIVRADLHSYLASVGAVDAKMPECIDIEEKWEEIASAYMPDGIREYNSSPVVALGWMMFIGMAMAAFWDGNWDKYREDSELYDHLKDARGFDYMDEYILEDIMHLDRNVSGKYSRIVAECASRTNSILVRGNVEPGTKAAFQAFVSCLHQMYLMGMAFGLKHLGYKMTPMTFGA